MKVYTGGRWVDLGTTGAASPFNVTPGVSAAENTLAIRAAIADGYVSMAPGIYPVARTASESELFLIGSGIEFNGNNAVMVLDASTPTTVDVFRIVPVGSVVGLHFHDLTLKAGADGAGRHGIFIDCPDSLASGFLTNARFEHLALGQGYEFNDVSLKINGGTSGGIWCSQFRDSYIQGCLSLLNLGDSLLFSGINSYTAKNRIGFDVTMKADAQMATFEDCNSVSYGGSFRAVLGSNNNVKLFRANFEHLEGNTLTAGAVCNITGGSRCAVVDSHIVDFGAGANHGLSITGVMPTVYNNRLGGGSGYDLLVDATNAYAPQASNLLDGGSYLNSGSSRAAI